MAQIFPILSEPPGRAASPDFVIHGYELPTGRGILALVRLHRPEDAMIVPAQQPSPQPSPDEALPVLLYDEPARIIEDLVFSTTPHTLPDGARFYTLRDPAAINIVCTEFQEKRLILAANEHVYRAALARHQASSSAPQPELKVNTTPIHPRGFLHLRPPRPEDALAAFLLNEESGAFEIAPLHRVLTLPQGSDPTPLLDQLRLFFHIEHLPSPLTPARIAYLLTHGTELGAAMIATVARNSYLLKGRLDVLEAIFPSRPADLAVLQHVLARSLPEIHLSPATLEDALRRSSSSHALVFFLNPPTLLEIQEAALHRRPLPPDTFHIVPQCPASLLRNALSGIGS